MSRKHNQRTRAEILAKRTELDVAVGRRRIPYRRPESRSKYMPHFGKKQAAKIAARELKLAA